MAMNAKGGWEDGAFVGTAEAAAGGGTLAAGIAKGRAIEQARTST